jgi:hypothetical protein
MPGQPSPASGPTPLAARRTLRLPPSAFAEDYAKRPSEPVLVGLRLISEAACGHAQVAAARTAWEAHPEPADVEPRADVYGSELMMNVLARATVEADDTRKPYFGKAPEDVIRIALAGGGIRRLWEAYEAFCVEMSPLSPALDDAGVEQFTARLTGGAIGKLDAATAGRVRRLLALVLVELVEPPTTP